jgi:hypothetical protein
MQTKRLLALAALAAGALSLGACETIQDTLGTGKSSPDEFLTVPKRPLVIPPDFSLPAPQPGAGSAAEIDAQAAARTAVASAASGPAQPPAPAQASVPAPAAEPAAAPAPAPAPGSGPDVLNAPGRR